MGSTVVRGERRARGLRGGRERRVGNVNPFPELGLGDAVVEIEHIDADALLRAFERSRAAWSDRAEELWSRVAEKRASAFEAGAAIRERLPARA